MVMSDRVRIQTWASLRPGLLARVEKVFLQLCPTLPWELAGDVGWSGEARVGFVHAAWGVCHLPGHWTPGS